MTMHKALHPRGDVDRLYVSRKEGGGSVGVVCYFGCFSRCASRIYGYCSLNYSHHKYNRKLYHQAKGME